MANGRGRFTKSSTKNSRAIMRRRPTATNQKKQIKSNQNQIVAIQRQLTLKKERIRWHCGFSEKYATAYPMIIPLTSGPSTTSPAVTNTTPPVSCVWNTTMTAYPQDSGALRSKVVVNTQWIDLAITGGNEPSPLYLTAFLVQLQEKTATQVYAETTNMSTLTRNVDFCTPLNGVVDSGYGPYMNNSRFKILKRLEFSTIAAGAGWPGGPPGGNTGSGLGAALKRTQFKVNYGNTVLKSTGNAATSESMQYAEIDPKHKRFIVIFSDNNLTDSEYPAVAMSSLVTGYAAE